MNYFFCSLCATVAVIGAASACTPNNPTTEQNPVLFIQGMVRDGWVCSPIEDKEDNHWHIICTIEMKK